MSAMSLADLLDELRHNILHDQSDQVAGASDYLWSDTTLVRYINQAHSRFARHSLCLQDNSSSITRFTTVAGSAPYQLDPSIFAVRSVRMAGDNQDLPRASHDPLNAYHVPDTLFFDPSMLEQMPPGKALAWTTDESVLTAADGTLSAVNLTLFPTISTAYAGISGQLRVIRQPLTTFSTANLNAYPEIPPDHHLDMLDWAAYLALRGVDTDVAGANAFQRAQDFAARFEAHCTDARKDVMRKMFAPQQWGFGHNGWSWESGNY